MFVIKLTGHDWTMLMISDISCYLRENLRLALDPETYRNPTHYWNLCPRDTLSGQQLYELFDACAAMKLEPLVSWV